MINNINKGGIQSVSPNPPPTPKNSKKWGTKVPNGKELPNTPSNDAILTACNILIVTCLSTNANSMNIKQIGFQDKDGYVYGDYLISVKKIKNNEK
jgi:hypothetical protein